MTRLTLIIPALVALLVSGPAWSEESGKFIVYYPGYQKCTKYIGNYAKGETNETPTGIIYPTKAALALGWMMGYISGINEEAKGKEDFFRMKFSEVASWVASWFALCGRGLCRCVGAAGARCCGWWKTPVFRGAIKKREGKTPRKRWRWAHFHHF